MRIYNDKIAFFNSYDQEITICDQDKQLFIREIVYPIEISSETIKKYIEKTFRNLVSIELGTFRRSTTFVNLANKSKRGNNIDKHWVDGEIYLIDYSSVDKEKYLFAAIDVTLKKKDIFNIIAKEIMHNEPSHIDKWGNC